MRNYKIRSQLNSDLMIMNSRAAASHHYNSATFTKDRTSDRRHMSTNVRASMNDSTTFENVVIEE